MRRYDDPVEVRKGPVGDGVDDLEEGPAQFLWRGGVGEGWGGTGAWWQSPGARAVIGSDDTGEVAVAERGADLLGERELWRVEAAAGMAPDPEDGPGGGVFDLSFDWADGSWQLVGCVD